MRTQRPAACLRCLPHLSTAPSISSKRHLLMSHNCECLEVSLPSAYLQMPPALGAPCKCSLSPTRARLPSTAQALHLARVPHRARAPGQHAGNSLRFSFRGRALLSKAGDLLRPPIALQEKVLSALTPAEVGARGPQASGLGEQGGPGPSPPTGETEPVSGVSMLSAGLELVFI